MGRKRDIGKVSRNALEKAIELMCIRLECAAEAVKREDGSYEESIKFMKNDELIKMAAFVLGIVRDEENKCADGELGNGDDEAGGIRVVMEESVEKLAK